MTALQTKLELASGFFAVLIAFFLPISTTATTISFFLAIILNLCAGNLSHKFNIIFSKRICLLFTAFFVAFIVGLTYTKASHQEAVNMTMRYSKFFFGLFLLPIFTHARWRQYAINAFIAAMLLTLLLSYLKYFGLFHYRPKLGVDSVFKNHIQTSFCMALAAYFLGQKVIEHSRFRWPIVLVLLALTYQILFINTGRSGYIIFFGLMIILFCQAAGWKGILLAGIVGFVLAGLLFTVPSSFKQRLEQVRHGFTMFADKKQMRETSTSIRLLFIDGAIHVIKKHPIIGTGTGSIVYATGHDTHIKSMYAINNSHNEYLNVAIQLGLIGLAILLLLQYFIFYDAFKLPTHWRRIAHATWFAIAFGCLFNSWLMDTVEGHFFIVFIMLAFAASHDNRLSHQNTD